uniref:NADH dehydrogenase subunit 6 n=1 Tax=Pseudorhabdosynochus yangjiangensis TaxID=1131907 RepID=A0A3G0WS92_9PLAT|nr:NADH dehydrogenase subunit 6 [Pseudorhabdosynochus yangjiangensis]
MVSFVLICAFMSTIGFLYMTNLIYYCLFLVLNSLIIVGGIFFLGGYPWYAMLFYMVYVGGVYILFIFLSIYTPNLNNSFELNILILILGIFFLFELTRGLNIVNIGVSDETKFLCSLSEGLSYLFISSFLVLGFFLVSYISSSKEMFIR